MSGLTDIMAIVRDMGVKWVLKTLTEGREKERIIQGLRDRLVTLRRQTYRGRPGEIRHCALCGRDEVTGCTETCGLREGWWDGKA